MWEAHNSPCCCCLVASVMSDSVQPHRRQPWNPAENMLPILPLLLNLYSELFSVAPKWAKKPSWICFLDKMDETSVSLFRSVFCSVAKSCLTFGEAMDCSTPGFPVLHHLPECAQTHVHWVGDAIQPSCPRSSSSPPAFNLSQHQGPFPESWLFTSGCQSIGASASVSVPPINIQNWFPLGLIGTDRFDLLAVQGTLKSLLQHQFANKYFC